MKTELYLHIPKSCHENWEEMTSVTKGKFCSICSKQVVDFSLLSDKEVLNYFTNATGNTCGRFTNDQLQRPLQETKIERKKNWKWLLASITSLIMTSRIYAQQRNDSFPLGKVMVQKPKIEEATVGMISVKPLAIDSVRVLPEVTVVSYGTKKCNVLMGDISSYSIVTKKDTVVAFIRKVLDVAGIQKNPLKIYPNPVVRNSSVNICVKEKGIYEVQLFDNGSRLLNIAEANTADKQEIINFQLPANLSSGFYYIRLLNRQTKKMYTDKLIVQ